MDGDPVAAQADLCLPVRTVHSRLERPQQHRYRAADPVAKVFLNPPVVVVTATAAALVIIVVIIVLLLVGGVPNPPPLRSLSPVASSSAAVTFCLSASTFA